MKTNKKLLLLATTAGLLGLTLGLSAAPPSGPAQVSKNRAVLASPRTLEEFPELARSAPPQDETRSKQSRLVELTRNRAVAASPRVLEEFPWLSRGDAGRAPRFEIAPLK